MEGPQYAVVPGSSSTSASPAASWPKRVGAGLLASALLAAAGAAARRGGAGPGALRSSLQGVPEEKDGFAYVPFAPPFNSQRESCGTLEDGMDYSAAEGGVSEVATLFNVGSASMCCSACAGYAECNMWTWGATPHTDWLTNVCWLKKLGAGEQLVKNPKPGVISGFPDPNVEKYGVAAPPASSSGELDGVESKAVDAQLLQAGEAGGPTRKCPGNLFVEGHGVVALVNAGGDTPGKDAGMVEVIAGDMVLPHMSGRTYFGKSCGEGGYDPSQYAAINLLGKTMSWTTDVSGTGCGCNAALYLTSMPQSTEEGTCAGDYYCDAMKVCGVACGEIDLQEANMYSWMSTLHTYNPLAGPDSLGVARGYGGSIGEPERRDWAHDEYGPGAKCIDTTRPFKVAVSFLTDAAGLLAALQLELSQDGCALQATNNADEYVLDGRRPKEELSAALAAGMTPIISYWKSADMLWMDGLGADGRGPCVKDAPDMCPEHVRFYGFSIESMA